jgi:hypothetical protein
LVPNYSHFFLFSDHNCEYISYLLHSCFIPRPSHFPQRYSQTPSINVLF